MPKLYLHIHWIYVVPSISFHTFLYRIKIVRDTWTFSMLLLYILWDDWPIFMISPSNQQLQQQLEYTLLKPDCHSWWISKMQSRREDNLEERYAIKFRFKLWKSSTETYGMLQTAFRPSYMNRAWVFEWHKRFKEGRGSVRNDEGCGRSKEVNTPELIGQRVRHSSNRLSGISSKKMHQSTTPSLSQTIWPGWPSRQFLSLLIVQTLLPVTLAYSLRLSLWDNFGDERGCDEGHWHARTRGLPRGLAEVVGTVQQRRRLLGRGLEFHVCTINKSAHAKKSLETYLMILVYVL